MSDLVHILLRTMGEHRVSGVEQRQPRHHLSVEIHVVVKLSQIGSVGGGAVLELWWSTWSKICVGMGCGTERQVEFKSGAVDYAGIAVACVQYIYAPMPHSANGWRVG